MGAIERDACHRVAGFLLAAAAEVRTYCDPLDADWLELAAGDCANTDEWELDMLQTALRALRRSRAHPGWSSLSAAGHFRRQPVDVVPLENAISVLSMTAKVAGLVMAQALEVSDAEFDRLRGVAKAWEGRAALITNMRDLWFGHLREYCESC
jgi:hypothetical protein